MIAVSVPHSFQRSEETFLRRFHQETCRAGLHGRINVARSRADRLYDRSIPWAVRVVRLMSLDIPDSSAATAYTGDGSQDIPRFGHV
jgi:hypothetical protein